MEYRKAIEAQTTTWTQPKFLTLTLKSQGLTLREEIQRITTSFRALRRRKYWTDRVTHGIWAVEVTRNARTMDWHVHLHCLLNATFLEKQWLSTEWHKITGDSFIVDIRKCDAKAVKYVAKYAAKGLNYDTVSETRKHKTKREWKDIWHVAENMKGLRLMGTFANAEKLKRAPDYEEFLLLGKVWELLNQVEQGEAWVVDALWEALSAKPDRRPPSAEPSTA